MMSSLSSNLTLPALYLRTLTSLLPVLSDSISSSTPEAQAILNASQQDLDLVARMLMSLGVFSENEELEEVGDSEMGFMSLGWVRGEVESRVGTKGIAARLKALEQTSAAYKSYTSLLSSYSFPLPPNLPSSSAPRNPSDRRDAKIKAFRLEKELKEKVLSSLPDTDVSTTPLPALISLLALSSSSSSQPSSIPTPSSSSTPANLRASTIALLQLLYVQTLAAVESVQQEKDLLKEALGNAHIEEDENEVERMGREAKGKGRGKNEEVDMTWRLDKPLRIPGRSKAAELIDDRGKPTQPFTILPSTGLQNMSDRARLQAEVFRSSHRLPTMTIDEYLQEEERRGNFISGGGPQQDAQLTTSELLALAAEQDGTRDAEEKGEEKRLKEEKWARYTEEHKKGEGNTMNRG